MSRLAENVDLTFVSHVSHSTSTFTGSCDVFVSSFVTLTCKGVGTIVGWSIALVMDCDVVMGRRCIVATTR
jgi:hypothetical protein